MKFAKYLKFLIDMQYYRLVDLQASTGVPSSDLSNIVREKRPCGRANMEKVIGGLKDEHKATALINWLNDQVPEQFVDLVHVVKAGSRGKVKEEPANANTVEGALSILKTTAESNPAVAKVLTNLAKSFKA